MSPRFYTTDFEAMENMDLSINEEELEAICEEFRKDYNRHHFVRNSEFEGAAEKLDPETRELRFMQHGVYGALSHKAAPEDKNKMEN